MSQTTHKIINTINDRKADTMSTPNHDDFEVVNASEIEFVKRGRKAEANPALIARLKTLQKGQTLAIKMMALDPNASTYAKDKARISSQIRTACRLANLKAFTINWNTAGIPHVTA